MSLFKRFLIEEDGQDMVEYGLVIALVVAGGAAIMAVYSTGVSAAFTSLGTAITTAL